MTTLLKITMIIATNEDPSTVLDAASDAALTLSQDHGGTMDEDAITDAVCVEEYAPSTVSAWRCSDCRALAELSADFCRCGAGRPEDRDDPSPPRAVGVNVDVSDERIADLLTTAMEGGSAYWCRIKRYENPDAESVEYKHIELPLTARGAVVCMDSDDDLTEWRLDRAAVERGLKLMAAKHPRHWGDFISEQDDADTADCFLQCALLGEIVYA